MRFDELELDAVPVTEAVTPESPVVSSDASRLKRLLALLTDLSLFVALALALSPLLPVAESVPATAALAGFVVIVSYYYFVCSWMLWGKTIGGAIFDVRIVADSGSAMALKAASLRWAGVYLAILTGGLGFLAAALPARRSLPDRVSQTHCVAAS